MKFDLIIDTESSLRVHEDMKPSNQKSNAFRLGRSRFQSQRTEALRRRPKNDMRNEPSKAFLKNTPPNIIHGIAARE